MTILMILVALVLGAVALIHALWGFGIWVPIRNEEALAHAVIGARGVTRMPGPIPCFLVASALCIVIVALWMPAGLVRSVILWSAAVVFLGRGLMPWTRVWRRMTSHEPFATNDRRLYGPLCLGLGVTITLIIFGGY